MATSYDTVYSAFLRKIEDINLPSMNENDQNAMLSGWLHDALGYIELDGLKIKTDLTDYDDTKCVFNNTLYNSEIVVVSLYMVVAWYDQKINSLENTLAFWGSKDERWSDQKKLRDASAATRNAYRLEARKYFNHYAYKHNDYLEGTL